MSGGRSKTPGASGLAKWLTARGWPIHLLLCTVGIAVLIRPTVLAARFGRVPGIDPAAFYPASVAVAKMLGACFLVWGAAGVLLRVLARHGAFAVQGVRMAAVVGTYLLCTAVFVDWHVDDAAITYAYSENLATGLGLRLHPNLPTEEAYSNTLWMLVLAGARACGAPIPWVAKLLGTGLGVLCIVGTARLLARDTGQWLSALNIALLGSLFCTAPFVIWSVSGLEHALQAAGFLGLVACGGVGSPRQRWRFSAIGAGLVLVRPEAPLILAAVAISHAWDRWRERRTLAPILQLWTLPVLPLLALAGLVLFRIAYFGDPLPNPYYAKGTSATPARLLNLVGGAWEYVFSWLRAGGIGALFGVWVFLPAQRLPPTVRVALAIVGAQVAFAVYTDGDWMGHWRFMAPVVPMLAFITGYAHAANAAERSCQLPLKVPLAIAAVTFIGISSVRHFIEFRARPTTPFASVAHVGQRFAALSADLGIERPRLAHHDAGGTSYRSGVELVDLAGLGNRTIAKNMRDHTFVHRYLLEHAQPDFVFGSASTFAAGISRFHETPRFERDYVPLRFEDDALMEADLCHIRRDRVREVAGLRVVRRADQIIEVVVFDPATVSAGAGRDLAAGPRQ
ncbi:MAG: hypothetical protein B7733_05020 [Myxococcales bacterium FL481]|nr:MAG: hypothetical protein B7733_05020 [Myxococcales bacterium FL481]